MPHKIGAGSRPDRVRDLSGQRFGRLTAVHVAGRDSNNRAQWRCKCDCSVHCVVASRHLVQGRQHSCGCLARELAPISARRGAWKISGPRSHLYNPALSDSDRAEGRNIPELRDWRRAVFLCDDFTCRVCHKRGRKLHAHHLHSWAEHTSLRLDVQNGATVCRDEHREFHNWLGGPRVPCTPADFDRFIALKKESLVA